jgi:uncharacterized protein (DUF1810 family)
MDDAFRLARFLAAQDPIYPRVLAELRAGEKRTHWMWFIFPQLAGLGTSAMARRYAIAGLAEAAAYWAHPLLGARLRECTSLVSAVPGKPIAAILPPPDEVKFRSSMTLFSAVAGPGSVFEAALEKYFDGRPDERTLARLNP